MGNKIVDKCYCCHKEKEGSYLEYNKEKRFCCNDCNHLTIENKEAENA